MIYDNIDTILALMKCSKSQFTTIVAYTLPVEVYSDSCSETNSTIWTCEYYNCVMHVNQVPQIVFQVIVQKRAIFERTNLSVVKHTHVPFSDVRVE